STHAFNCAGYLTCSTSQPPQRPKYGQGGTTRLGEGVIISYIEANETFPFARSTRTRRRSPGAASATMTVRPSACAIPNPPGRIRSIVTSMVEKQRLLTFRSGLPPAWSGRSPTLNGQAVCAQTGVVGHL